MTAPLAALVLAATVLGGCGYSLRGHLPEHIRTVAVPVFANRTPQPGVENQLTAAVVEAFATNGRLRVVRPEEADAVLEGEVVGYDVQSVAFDRGANVRRFRLTVSLNLRLRDVRRNQVLLEERGFNDRADFEVRGQVAETIGLEKQGAVREAAEKIARAVVNLALERF